MLGLTAALPAFLYTLVRALRDGGTRYLCQRYACSLPENLQDRICLHCCSVGEVRAALPLAQKLIDDGRALLISVSTPTGQRMASALLPDLPRVYFPLDHVQIVRRWLKRLRPKALLIVETELWPNFFAAAYRMEIPLALVNARLSRRTENPPALLRPALRQAIQQLHCVLARSEKDAARFSAMGAPADRVENLGNMKYAETVEDIPGTAPIHLPYVLAVSTHENEEEQLARLWQAIDTQGQLLVLMPRYPDRAPKIMRHLEALDLQVGLHSRDSQPRPDDQIYLADSLGEALWWMRHATFVFVGGSLVKRGGHNVLEPARLGRACVVGPHTDHFEAEVMDLLASHGLRQVKNIRELAQIFSEWIKHPRQAEKTGLRAQAHMHDRNQVINRYIETLRRYSVLE